MSYVEQVKKIYNQPLWEISSVKKERLGTLRVLDDGRVFVYAKAGSTDLAAGLLGTYITTPTHEDTVTVAHPAGTKEVTITASGVSANDFQDGFLVVTEGTGAGEIYKIKSNTATVNGLITVTLYEPLITGWSTTDTDVDLYPNPYNGIVVNPVDAQQKPTVLTPRPVTAGYYYWAQVRGPAALKIDTSGGAAGLEADEKVIIPSTATAGEGKITGSPSAANLPYHVVGYLIKEADVADSTATLVDLRLL